MSTRWNATRSKKYCDRKRGHFSRYFLEIIAVVVVIVVDLDGTVDIIFVAAVDFNDALAVECCCKMLSFLILLLLSLLMLLKNVVVVISRFLVMLGTSSFQARHYVFICFPI